MLHWIVALDVALTITLALTLSATLAASDGEPWHPSRPRISAALVNAQLDKEPDRGNIPLYSYSLAGLVLAPGSNSVRCCYAFDTGSLQFNGACNNWRCVTAVTVVPSVTAVSSSTGRATAGGA